MGSSAGGARGCSNFGVVLGAGCFLLLSGLSADQQPTGNTRNGINAGRKTGMQAGNQPGGHQPTEATAAASAGTHTQAHMGLVCPHAACPGAARSQVSPGPMHVAACFSVHHVKGADGPKISSSNWEESQHQVTDSSETETPLGTSVMAGKTVQTSEASSAARCRAAPPTHRQT